MSDHQARYGLTSIKAEFFELVRSLHAADSGVRSLLFSTGFSMRTPFVANWICFSLSLVVAVTLAVARPIELLAGTITYLPITDDSTSGISSTKNYTHAIDYGNSGAALVNGVQFTQGSPGAMPGPSPSNSLGTGSVNMTANHGGGGSAIPVPLASGVHNLLNDFVYNASAGTIQLTNLTPGREYDFRLYHRQWDPSARPVQLRFDGNGDNVFEDVINIDEDNAALVPPGLASANTPYALSYKFLAGNSGLLNIQLNQTGGGTYHLYGLTNELLAVPEPTSIFCWTLMAVSGVGLGLLRRKFGA